MFFLRPPVLCDGSKRQTTAFNRYSHPASPPRDTTPVFFISQLLFVYDNLYGGRTLVRCPGVAAVTFFLPDGAS